MSGLRLLRVDDAPAQPWKNGGGITRELLRLGAAPGDPAASDAAWGLRISVADIAADGPFSPFPGIDRHFAVLSGAGVRLHFPGRAAIDCRVGEPPLAFDGAEAPGCSLLDGATRDLNVMADRRHGRATLAPAHAGMPAAVQAGARAWGVFVGTPARLARAGRPDIALAAGTLAWQDDARDVREAWTLHAPHPATAGGPASPWFWITYTPHATPR